MRERERERERERAGEREGEGERERKGEEKNENLLNNKRSISFKQKKVDECTYICCNKELENGIGILTRQSLLKYGSKQ